MLGAGTYRPYIENRIRADNTTLSRLPACPTTSQHESQVVVLGTSLWHYELRRKAIDDGCPSRYADPSTIQGCSDDQPNDPSPGNAGSLLAIRPDLRRDRTRFTSRPAIDPARACVHLHRPRHARARHRPQCRDFLRRLRRNFRRPLPYPNPDRLIIISSAQQTETGVRTFSTWPPVTYEGLRPRVTTLDHLAAYTSIDVQLTGRGEPLQLPALGVSPNFFATLGVNPARGRAFLTGRRARRRSRRDRQRSALAHVARRRSGDRRAVHHHRRSPAPSSACLGRPSPSGR